MVKMDGLKLLVRAEYNFGNLQMVSKKSGVKEDVIKKWLFEDIELQELDRKKLSKGIAPEFCGMVEIN